MTTRRAGSVSVSRTHRSSNNSKQPKVPAIVIITAIAILYRLATTIVTTTSLTIVHKAACQIWYETNKPDAYPDGSIPEEFCTIPEVDRYYTALFSILSIVDGMAGMSYWFFVLFCLPHFYSILQVYSARPHRVTWLRDSAESQSSFGCLSSP